MTSFTTWQAILVLGIIFIVLGIVSVLWNKREQTRYFDSISNRKDVKEFLTGEPNRPWLNAWLIGGRIFLVIGIVILIVSFVVK